MSEINNMNLETAGFAMECVDDVINKEFSENYKILVKKMPAMIQKNGFISVLAFCYSKGKDEHEEVLNNIIKWSTKNRRTKSMVECNKCKTEEYIEFIVSCESNKYRLISKEMMILFGWIKRFADGMIESKKAGSDNE